MLKNQLPYWFYILFILQSVRGNSQVDNSLFALARLNPEDAQYIPDSLIDNFYLNIDGCIDVHLLYKLDEVYGMNESSYRVDSIWAVPTNEKLSDFLHELTVCKAFYSSGKVIWNDFQGIKIEDYNFDGYDDIYLFDYENSGQGNNVQKIWTYRPLIKKFQLDSFLTSLPILSIDKEKKIITTSSRAGYYFYHQEKYQLVKHTFIKIESLESSFDEKVQKQILIRKKWNGHKWTTVREEKKIE